MELESEDPRTDQEKEHDLLREAQSLTSTMFPATETPDEKETVEIQDKKQYSPKISPVLEIVGYRARAGRAKARVRTRSWKAKQAG
jgi:hypothetical protein